MYIVVFDKYKTDFAFFSTKEKAEQFVHDMGIKKYDILKVETPSHFTIN